MAGLEEILAKIGAQDYIASSPTLSSVARTFGLKKAPEWQQPEFSGDVGDVYTNVNPLQVFPRSSRPTDLPESTKAYRYDTKQQTKTGLESLPIQQFDVGAEGAMGRPKSPTGGNTYDNPIKANQELYRYARLAGAAEKHGYPTLDANALAAFALKEGRADYGFNGGDKEQEASNFSKKMQRELNSKFNAHPEDLRFITHIAEKQRIADKFGIPFARAWNGVGKNKHGQTGKEYAQSWELHKEAAMRPENQPLMQLIQRGIEDGRKFGLPLIENKAKDSTGSYRSDDYKRGGSIEKPLSGNTKII